MRFAKFNDGWRRTQDLSHYNCQLRRVSISNIKGVADDFCLELNNGISVICGKNGVGKSTILRTIHSYFKKNDSYRTRLNEASINVSLMKGGAVIENIEDIQVYYLEPSVE
ncbi:AAA family ATPase, partial [Escherichia coli]